MRPVHFVLAMVLVTGFGTHSARVLLTLYALNLGASPFAIGILAATTSLFPLLLSVWAGNLNDRLGSRWPLTVSIAGAALVMLVPFFFPTLTAMYIAAAVMGLSFTFYNVAFQNLVGLLSTAENRVQSFSNFSIMVASATFVGPLIAGFSIEHVGYATASLYVALVWLAPVVMLAMWGKVLPGGNRQTSASRGGVRSTLADPKVRRVLIICSLIQSGFDLFMFYMPVYANSVGLSPSAIGIVLAMFAAASFLARLVVQGLVRRLTVEKVLIYSFSLAAASLLLVPFFESVVTLALISFVFGLGISCGQPITMTLIFSQSAQGRSGEAMGLRLTVNHLTRFAAPIVFGGIATVFGLFPIFWLNGLMLAAGGLLSRAKKAS